ncbi:MAG: tRNA preQ1(34) S-adenosylmethionine ribosyltransferase-isomerase QueA [Clostridia bacterium]|nr:tRNA preQ1(34) S-adenosylmethionine ribosyltransferase-isomerase QueA [Clostridia bacterium]
MKKSDFYYELPEELIAQHPLEQRDASRLMLLHKQTGAIEHRHFYDLLDLLDENDCLVLNDTRVLPARIFGTKLQTGAVVEFLLLKQISGTEWECIVKPGKKAREGARFDFSGIMQCTVTKVLESGNRVITFEYEGNFFHLLEQIGSMPIPPYIKEKLENKERYQTVYSKHLGSAAAPTAGLHFTNEMLAKLKHKGVKIAYVTLHVGLGTFRPVKAENIENHVMHSEHYHIPDITAKIINETKTAGGRIIAVGTTSCRTLETAADENGMISPCEGDSEIFIYPGYRFKCIDALITNFHLPESTLIMLVSALAGRENVLHAYKEAVEQQYRFFSFGDAMFITDKI